MKELVIISGKGGTGKTSLAAAFAYLTGHSMICDTDVDAADLHLILNPEIKERHVFQAGHKAVITLDRCTRCGLCAELCRWEAIREDFRIDSIACEGCGVCVYCCPEQAIEFPINTCGEWYVSETRLGPMIHARLGVAEENSGRLVALVRQKASETATIQGIERIITDGPPGVGCPVIASIGGASAVLIVTEPTVSGKHDLKRVLELTDHFKIPAMVCINKHDLNPDISREIEDFTREKHLQLAGKIPFDPVFTKAMIHAKTILEYDPTAEASIAVQRIWETMNF